MTSVSFYVDEQKLVSKQQKVLSLLLLLMKIESYRNMKIPSLTGTKIARDLYGLNQVKLKLAENWRNGIIGYVIIWQK